MGFFSDIGDFFDDDLGPYFQKQIDLYREYEPPKFHMDVTHDVEIDIDVDVDIQAKVDFDSRDFIAAADRLADAIRQIDLSGGLLKEIRQRRDAHAKLKRALAELDAIFKFGAAGGPSDRLSLELTVGNEISRTEAARYPTKIWSKGQVLFVAKTETTSLAEKVRVRMPPKNGQERPWKKSIFVVPRNTKELSIDIDAVGAISVSRLYRNTGNWKHLIWEQSIPYTNAPTATDFQNLELGHRVPLRLKYLPKKGSVIESFWDEEHPFPVPESRFSSKPTGTLYQQIFETILQHITSPAMEWESIQNFRQSLIERVKGMNDPPLFTQVTPLHLGIEFAPPTGTGPYITTGFSPTMGNVDCWIFAPPADTSDETDSRPVAFLVDGEEDDYNFEENQPFLSGAMCVAATQVCQVPPPEKLPDGRRRHLLVRVQFAGAIHWRPRLRLLAGFDWSRRILTEAEGDDQNQSTEEVEHNTWWWKVELPDNPL